jgi:hypothetical protein
LRHRSLQTVKVFRLSAPTPDTRNRISRELHDSRLVDAGDLTERRTEQRRARIGGPDGIRYVECRRPELEFARLRVFVVNPRFLEVQPELAGEVAGLWVGAESSLALELSEDGSGYIYGAANGDSLRIVRPWMIQDIQRIDAQL